MSKQTTYNILCTLLWDTGRCPLLSFADYAPILEMIGRPKEKQASVYRRFVETGISDMDAAFVNAKKQSRLCIRSLGLAQVRPGLSCELRSESKKHVPWANHESGSNPKIATSFLMHGP